MSTAEGRDVCARRAAGEPAALVCLGLASLIGLACLGAPSAIGALPRCARRGHHQRRHAARAGGGRLSYAHDHRACSASRPPLAGPPAIAGAGSASDADLLDWMVAAVALYVLLPADLSISFLTLIFLRSKTSAA
jgi:hypothetical protein